MEKNKQELSENLEDYLEAISNLSEKGGNVRPSDIASELKVKRPSVTAALNSLSGKGLVVYEKYKPVTLTKEGQELASGVMKKHELLRNFFTEILGVEATEADIAACKMEHALADTMVQKLTRFIKGFSSSKKKESAVEHESCPDCPSKNGEECEKCCKNATDLANLKVGEAGVILCIDKSLGDLPCYAGMGLVIGSRVEIIRIAPFGDPVVLSVRGTEISLRKSQLNAIRVKRCD